MVAASHRLIGRQGVQGNDRRGAHEFLERIIADGKRLEAKNGTTYEVANGAVEALRSADKWLITAGNRGSHTFDVDSSEASRMVAECEAALAALGCTICQTRVWHVHVEPERIIRCDCGNLRWRYP